MKYICVLHNFILLFNVLFNNELYVIYYDNTNMLITFLINHFD